MVDLREVWAWFVFYLISSLLALIVAGVSLQYLWPGYDIDEQSSGPLEQQFYLLLADRGYWMTGHSRDSEFVEGIDLPRRLATTVSRIQF